MDRIDRIFQDEQDSLFTNQPVNPEKSRQSCPFASLRIGWFRSRVRPWPKRRSRPDLPSIKEIAARVGIGDPSYFSRIFKDVHGRSPSEYRERFLRERRRNAAELSCK
ncbi:MAG: helix-turn-helix domain-containing protein [Blastocatellia bacterium]|nr:helix-turn-helix domain-containing protein [Blastocatellia bacterium]